MKPAIIVHALSFAYDVSFTSGAMMFADAVRKVF